MRKPLCEECYPINVMEENAFGRMLEDLYEEVLRTKTAWSTAEADRRQMEETETLLRGILEELGRPLSSSEKDTRLHAGMQSLEAANEALRRAEDYTEACEELRSFLEVNEAVYEEVRKGKKLGLIRGLETARARYHRTVEKAENEYRTIVHDTDRIIHYLMEAFQQFPLPEEEMEEADTVGVERIMDLHLKEVDRELERYLKRYTPEGFYEDHTDQLPMVHMSFFQFSAWFRDHTGMSVMDAYESVILSAVELYRKKADAAKAHRDRICSEAERLYEAERFTALLSYNELSSFGSSSFGDAFEAYHEAVRTIPEDESDPAVLTGPFELFREELRAWL